jgi:predicted acyltransferase
MMGMNSIVLYVGDGALARIIMWFYIDTPDNNLVAWWARVLKRGFGSRGGILVYALVDVTFWLGVGAYLFAKRKFYKI